MKRFLYATLAVFALAQAGVGLAAGQQSREVQVVGVSDGDTITVIDAGQAQHRVRLAGIDAPETGQPFSERSKQALSDLVFRRTVMIQWSKTDRYGRILARVLATPPGPCPLPCIVRLDVNLAQVDAGMAWHYKAYAGEQSRSDRKAFAEAELRARERRIGIWSQPDPVAPWEQRHGPEGSEVRKSRNDICHAPGMPTYSSVQKYDAFPTLEACVRSGGRPPRGSGDAAAEPPLTER